MKYVENDKVIVKSLDWYNANKDCDGAVILQKCDFIQEMSEYCGKTAQVKKVSRNTYKLTIDDGKYRWTDEMLEPVEKNRMVVISLEKAKEWYNKGGELRDIALQAYSKDELDDVLPKTWEECIKRLESCEYIDTYSNIKIFSGRIDVHKNVSSKYKNCLPTGMGKAILALNQLLVCREVYRQGWKPNWTDDTYKYCIYYEENEITIRCNKRVSIMLSFETKEITKKFLENFRDLIEEAKELL